MTPSDDPMIQTIYSMVEAADTHDTTTLAHLYRTHINTPREAALYLVAITDLAGFAMRHGQQSLAIAAHLDPNNSDEQETAIRTALSMITIAANQPHDPELADYAIATTNTGEQHTITVITAALAIIAQQIRAGLFDGYNGAPTLTGYTPPDKAAAARALAQTAAPWQPGCTTCTTLRGHTHPGTPTWIHETAHHFSTQHTAEIAAYLAAHGLRNTGPWVEGCDTCTGYRTNPQPQHPAWKAATTSHLMNTHTRTPTEDWSS
jgi:hypothetical protein